MAEAQTEPIYNDLVELLADGVDVSRLLEFRLSEGKQARLDELLDKNREESLKESERLELDEYSRFEHVVRMVKARALQNRKP